MDSFTIYAYRDMQYAYCRIFYGNMDIDSKPFLFRRKESILHCNMHTARILQVAICILQFYCIMHIAIKILENSSPNEQTWSNTFHGTLGVRCKEYPILNTPQVAPSPQLQNSFLFAGIHIAHSNMHVWSKSILHIAICIFGRVNPYCT
jgi:hypothetical protein